MVIELASSAEVGGLRWCDVDWENMRVTVHSPKTEHHEGHDKRIIPLFDELVEPLQDAWEMANEGEEYVVPLASQVSSAAIRKHVIAAIEATGETPWPKLFVALRATRDTELREHSPGHVVDAWIGHSEAVARKNYLQVTDDHFDRYTQKAKQYTAATGRIASHAASGDTKKPRDSRESRGLVQSLVGVTGFEPSLENPVFSHSEPQSEAKGEAVSAEIVPFDADLRTIIECWPKLPGAMKAEIGAIVNRFPRQTD